MTKEIAKKDAGSVNVDMESFGAFGSEEVEAQDIRIPKVLLMQSISQAVTDGKADSGDFVNSITLVPFANCSSAKRKEKTFKIIPIYFFKSWMITEEVEGKQEFLTIEPYSSSNFQKGREEIFNGVKRQNNLTYNILCMREEDLSDPTAFPHMISVNRMSSNFGKDIFSFGQKAQMAKKPACAYTIEVGGEIMKNTKGSFNVWKVRGVAETKDLQKHIARMKLWYDTFVAGKAKVDDSDLKDMTKEADSDGTYAGQF